MLNYPNPERFFENCLIEAGLSEVAFKLNEARNNPAIRNPLTRALLDIQTGADAVLARGKPSEDSLKLTFEEWDRRWTAWAASRKAAFYSRACLLMLGKTECKDYFIKTLRTSHNIVFLGAASDGLQHSSGRYLNGPEEDFTNAQMADLWEASHV